MSLLLYLGGAAAALLAIWALLRGAVRRTRAGVSEVRRWAAIADDLRKQLVGAAAATHSQLAQIATSLATWGAEDQKRHSLVLGTAQEALAAARMVQTFADGLDLRLEVLEGYHDRPATHPPLIGAAA